MPTFRYAKSQIAIPWLSDVLVVFPLVFGSADECHAAADRIRPTLHARQAARAEAINA